MTGPGTPYAASTRARSVAVQAKLLAAGRHGAGGDAAGDVGVEADRLLGLGAIAGDDDRLGLDALQGRVEGGFADAASQRFCTDPGEKLGERRARWRVLAQQQPGIARTPHAIAQTCSARPGRAVTSPRSSIAIVNRSIINESSIHNFKSSMQVSLFFLFLLLAPLGFRRGDDLAVKVRRHFVVVRELHVVGAASAGLRRQRLLVAEHL